MVEIGMAGLDTDTGEITKELDRLIKPTENDELPDDCWIYHNSKPPITPELLERDGEEWRLLRRAVKAIIDNDKVTAYNRQFDMRWLFHRGVDVSPVKMAPCPMMVMTDVCRIPGYYGDYKWPKFTEAWQELFGEPVDEPHRAYGDAELEARLIYEMIGRGIYAI